MSMKQILERSRLVITVVVLFFMLVAAQPLQAILGQDTADAATQSGQGLEISPPLIEFTTDPGKTVSVSIKLRNITDSPLVARARIDDFLAQGEEGLPKLLLDEDAAETSPYSFKPWVSSIPAVSLAPKQQKAIQVTFNVPGDASPGGHYGVIRFTAAAPEVEQTGVALAASIGTLVLINVSGDVKTAATIEQFFVSQNAGGKPSSFFEQGPLTFVERIKNTGNVHIKPVGEVKINNSFGKNVATLQVNEKNGNVLPASVRRFEQTMDKKLLFGRYTAQANLFYGDGQTLTQTISFWVIPYKLIALAIGALVLAVFLIRRYNRAIVKKANKKRK